MRILKNALLGLGLMTSTLQTMNAQNYNVNHGDLIFASIQCGPICDAIDRVTTGKNNFTFNHMGVVAKGNDNILYVYEANGNGVVKTKLKDFVANIPLQVYVGKINDKNKPNANLVVAFCESMLGRPYDNDFMLNNDKYYCSELVYDAFMMANNFEPYFQLAPMTFKDKYTNETVEFWTQYFDQLDRKVPEGKMGINPNGITMDERVELIPLEIKK